MKLILIETEETFELFDDIDKAFKYCEQLKKENEKIKRIDLVDANKGNIYYENDGSLNYEDNSELIKSEILSDGY